MRDDENEFYLAWAKSMYEGHLAKWNRSRSPSNEKHSPLFLHALGETQDWNDRAPILEWLSKPGPKTQADLVVLAEWIAKLRKAPSKATKALGPPRKISMFSHEMTEKSARLLAAKRYSLKLQKENKKKQKANELAADKFGLSIEELKSPSGHLQRQLKRY